MSNLVTLLTPEQVAAQVKADEHEGIAHRVVEMLDATAETVAGPQDQTISSATAQAVLSGHGIEKTAADTLDKVLNAFSPDHGEKAMIADYVRAMLEAERLAGVLDPLTRAKVDDVLNLTLALPGAE